MIPLLLKPAIKDYLWGGTRLKEEFNKNTEMDIVAETWECSVHPDDEYARTFEGQNGKTEMWYILDASKDAKLIYGIKDGITKPEFVQEVSNGKIMECLNQVDINRGESYFIPAGMVHAIGAGILVAEIQENSNVTYRLYDYDRVDKNGKKKELHLDKALEVIEYKSVVKNKAIKKYSDAGNYKYSELCSCEYFTVNKYEVKTISSIYIGKESFQVILCTEGKASLKCKDEELEFKKGHCIFLPAGLGNCAIEGNVEFLSVIC